MAAAAAVLTGQAAAEDTSDGPKVKIGGYAKVDFIQDFDPIGNASQFKTDAIPVGDTEQGGQTTVQARETRLTATLHDDTPQGPLKAYVEGDFYGDGNAFRLRHAYGEFDDFLGGQTWTTFQDISARPRSLDYEGPDAEIFVRQAMIRHTRTLSPGWKGAVALEQPGSQISGASGMSGAGRNNLPDLPLHVRYESDRAHVQVGGIVRQIRFDGEGDTPDASTAGFGGNLSFRANTAGKSGVMGQLAAGQGIARYIESLNGQNADAVFREDGALEALVAWAAVIAYEHHWSGVLQSSVALSMATLDEDEDLSAGAIKMTQDARANLIWSPAEKVDVGGEVLWGRRENQNGEDGTALRAQFSMIVKIG